MNVRKNLSYHNSESPESPLNVKYKYREGTKTLEINKSHTPKINILPIIKKNNIINKSNNLRIQQYNSYTNENMDFFRLDYLKECDRDNYHNKNLNCLTPINRNENFRKLNEEREKIKYIESIKNNFLLKKENNKKDFFKNNLYTSENILKDIYYKKMNKLYNNKLNNNQNYDNRYIYNGRYGKINNSYNYNKGTNDKIYKNNTSNDQKYSGAYLSNINEYSIQGNQNFNTLNNNNLSKLSVLSEQSHLFCKDAINNDIPALFYKVYDYNLNKDGFKKQNNIFSNSIKFYNKGEFLKRKINP